MWRSIEKIKTKKTRDVLRYQEKNQTKNKIIRNISKKSLCTQLFYDNKESIQILKKYVCAETDIFKSTFKISIMLKKCMYIQKLSNRVRVFTLCIKEDVISGSYVLWGFG